ncbi:MAG: diguanylate cyclase [Sulfuricella sp.]|nr:diguanylate cyclase [Sulfuricella sp.]
MTNSADQLKKDLDALCLVFAGKLAGKISRIENSWAGIEQGKWDTEVFHDLHRQVHSLAGAGATFGFSRLSDTARTLERLLLQVADESGMPLSAEQREQVAASLGAMVQAALEPDQERGVGASPSLPATLSPDPMDTGGPRLVFLVDGDISPAHGLSQKISYFGYQVQVFSGLEALKAGLAQACPAAIIMDHAAFPGDDTGCADAVAEVRRLCAIPVPVLFVSSRSDLPARLEAVRAGCSAYFTKPVDVGRVIDKLDALTTRRPPEAYRVLVVDDSISLGAFHAHILECAGMETQTIDNPMRALDKMTEFRPDLVLMDVYMPECSGLELAAVIRQQEEFVGIPIVFLSVEDDLDRQLFAMKLGGDDFLHKPIQPEHLVSSVTSRVERSRALRSLMVRDSLTGLLNHTTIMEQLEIQVGRSQRLGGSLSFAMLDIDHFKMVNDAYGHPVGDRVLKSLSRLLRQRLRETDFIGRYGGEEFAVILNDTDGPAAVKVLDQIRDDFSRLRYLAESGEFSVTLSCGVAAFPLYADAGKLNDAADKALYEAKRAGRNRLVLAPG